MKPTGRRQMNAEGGSAPPDATIIVSGPPRGGTSFVAAALHAAGLWLGDLIDRTVFEDIELSGEVATRWRLTRHLDWPALRHVDAGVLRRLIASRDAAFPRWGFKRPNIAPALVARSGETLFRKPRLVMVFRDPVALAERVAMAEGLDMATALRISCEHNEQNLRTARRATIPILLASYEKAVARRPAFYDELFAFCGMTVDPADYPRIDAAVDVAGASYLQLAGAPISGFINRYTDGVLYGWCRIAGRKEPASVEIWAGDQLVAGARADQYRPSLRKAGHGHGRHGFAVRLDHLGLAPETRIRATIAGPCTEIANGGRTLAELTTLSARRADGA